MIKESVKSDLDETTPLSNWIKEKIKSKRIYPAATQCFKIVWIIKKQLPIVPIFE